MRRIVKAAALVLVAGCAHRSLNPTEALDLANEAAGQQGSASDAHTQALAGWHALLITGDATLARTRFDTSAQTSPTEPYALYGHAMLALRSAAPAKALGIALDLIEKNPGHPLGIAAARIVMELNGSASSTDDQILERAPKLLDAVPLAETAFLLRASLASIQLSRNDVAAHAQTLAQMGMATAATFVGPFSAWHTLNAGDRVGPEKNGSLESLGRGPFGPLTARTLQFADGRFSLAGEAPTGDVYLLAVDAAVEDEGSYLVRTTSSMDYAVTIDGTTVLERFTWQRPAPTVLASHVTLSSGTHRIMVRMTKEDAQGQLSLALVRADGRASNITYTPAKGAAATWAGLKRAAEGVSNGAPGLYELLEPDAGEALARFIAARDTIGRHRDGAWRMVNALPSTVNGPAVQVLRAELAMQDRTMVSKVARGRATRDLENALAKDEGFISARLLTAQLALDDGRQLEALTAVKAARAASGKSVTAPVLELQARIELALGLDAQAAATAREADEVTKGSCEALLLRYDVARRRDAAAEADTLRAASSRCASSLARDVEHFRARGDLSAATTASRQLFARDQSQVNVGATLVRLLVAQQKLDEALAVLHALRAQWPRNPNILKHEAEVLELFGRDADALALREAALALDGSDLSLRRAVERTKTGKELLADHAISTEEALKAYEAAPGNEEATAAFLLDAAAIRAYPDGSQVDRIHIIEKALDSQGVSEIAEVNLPEGAQVLKLRTIKADGSTLEPESIEGKETVSMPAVQVGDLVEYEFLLAHPSRGPAQPGFTSAAFYFQVAGQPNNWSTYTVIAPKGAGMKVDAHNMESPGPRIEGDEEVYFHEERRVRPYIPEPGGPVSANEFLPFVTVGAGQTGNEGVVSAYADAFLDKGQITHDVESFARAAAQDKTGLDAVKAVYAAVMAKLSGRDQGLGLSAAASVSLDRGSRTWLLKASLTALGFDARLVAVRAFTSDPAAYQFPAEALLPYICVRVTLPQREGETSGAPVWLDSFVRFAPFGELPEAAMGEREAYVLPEPGKPLEKVKTPVATREPQKSVTLDLSLAQDGVLTGTGVEKYTGFEAAQLSEGLDNLSVDQRNQALQQALSRYFGGADMSSIEVDAKPEVGGTVTITYKFTANRFGRLESDTRLVLGPLTYPALLGRRFLNLSRRRTPLLIASTEATHTVTTLALPKGFEVVGLEPLVELKGPEGVGRFLRTEKQQGSTVVIDETLVLPAARVSPKQYDAFGQFAGEVDLVQGHDVLVEKKK